MMSRDVQGNVYDVAVKDLSWRPSAYGIVLRDNAILLNKESGKYHLPGGGIDLGEDPKLAVIRELREETGCTVREPKLLDVASSLFSYGAYDSPPNLQHVHSLLLYYSCEFVSFNADDIALDEFEAQDGLTSKWIALDQLNTIPVGTTVDWRPLIQQILLSN